MHKQGRLTYEKFEPARVHQREAKHGFTSCNVCA